MDKAKVDHDKKIRKFEYKVGDIVLVNSPMLPKTGLCTGLAKKYIGVYEVIGINPNGIDYILRKIQEKYTKPIQIHKDRLKIFY